MTSGGPLTAPVRFRCAMLAVAFAAMFYAAPADAAERGPLVLTGPASVEALNRHLEYTIDPDWQLTVNDFVGPSAVEMQPLPGPRPDFGYTTAKIWLRLNLVNGTAAQRDWRFFVHVAFLQQLAIYRIDADWYDRRRSST